MLIFIVVCLIGATLSELVPQPKFEVFRPKGLRVSIPDNGFSHVGFYGYVNYKLVRFEAGHLSKCATRIASGSWVMEDSSVELKIGGPIYYSLYVIKDGKRHSQSSFKVWILKEYSKEVLHGSRNLEDPFVPQTLISKRYYNYPELSVAPSSVSPSIRHTMSNVCFALTGVFNALLLLK